MFFPDDARINVTFFIFFRNGFLMVNLKLDRSRTPRAGTAISPYHTQLRGGPVRLLYHHDYYSTYTVVWSHLLEYLLISMSF